MNKIIKKSIPPIYENWLAFNDNKSSQIITEYPLLSDAYIVGENATDFGPYQIINPCPPINKIPKVQTVLILRVDMRLDSQLPDMEETDLGYYHGGRLVDEIAAFVSLALGVRIKAGGKMREFYPNGERFGRPVEWERRPIPSISFQYSNFILPSAVVAGHSIEKLAILKSLVKLSEDNTIALIRAARLYQDALWIVESDPALAWIMFVSAIEVAANQWRRSKISDEERLKASNPKLYNYLQKTGVDNITKDVASFISHTLGAAKKFIDFIMAFLPSVPSQRPHKNAQHPWSKTKLKSSLSIIYDYRSSALHGGIPFPEPMCNAPFRHKEWDAPAEIPMGLSCHTKGATWKREDTPMLIHLFEYIVRNALLNWWNSI